MYGRKQGFGKALSTLLHGLFGLRGIEKCFKNKVGKEDRLWNNTMIILGCWVFNETNTKITVLIDFCFI